jgi:peptidoglycan/LPS O-acetylase OafA/YrhL
MSTPLIDATTSRRLTALRALLMLCVVGIHSEKGVLFNLAAEAPLAQALFNVVCRHIFQTAVPLYFAMSGYLLFLRYDGNLAEYPRLALKRFRSIFLPFLLINGFWIAYLMISGGIPGIGGTTYLRERGVFSLLLGVNGLPLIYPLWFLRDLFVFFLLAPAFGFVLRRAPYLGLCALWLCWNFMELKALPVDYGGAFFFCLGGLLALRRANLDAWSRALWPMCLVWAALIAVSASIQLGSPLILDVQWLFPMWRLSILAGAVAVWQLSGLVRLGESRVLLRLAPSIFFIYLLHEPVLSYLADWTGGLVSAGSSLSQLGYALLLALTTVAITYAMGWILRRIAPPVYSVLTGGR